MSTKTAGNKKDSKTRMKTASKNPLLYQVNTRVYLTELQKQFACQASLDDIPDSFFDDLLQQGFDWVYFLSVWQTGEAGKLISCNHPGWREGFLVDLLDLEDNDICGSGFAITDYCLNKAFGAPEALSRLHQRLNKRGLRLMLDLVPNHTAIDHNWTITHPEYYISGDEEAIANAPQNFIRIGETILAHGRDPYFDGWPDTLQLDLGSSDLQKAMQAEIGKIANYCDGLRCDMAMLILPDVFKNTWSIEIEPFWNDAIQTVKKEHPDFLFMAEVYWDREWDLQQQGFDYTYDKRLYDRLRQGQARPVREHFLAELDYQMASARFLENHDEPRAAGVFSISQHKAAAVLTFLSPGLRFVHQGQLEGFKKRVSVHLRRRPVEEADMEISRFYESLLGCCNLPAIRNGNWKLLNCARAWEDNWTSDCFIAFFFREVTTDKKAIVIVNYSNNQSQCRLTYPGCEKNGQLNLIFSGREKRTPLEIDEDGRTSLFVDLSAWDFMVLCC
ncbi:MAG: hypothetical protein K8F91_10110 [Candidatus Obscuribacterales bacterium]|nr:hypothetical protein [Candidatus Obscuribacterales bacterium]